MKYKELVRRVESLPDVGESFRPYLLQWSQDGRPTMALITLIPRTDGTFTASEGDLREKIELVRNTDRSVRVFADEDAACDWAWEQTRASRGPAPVYTPEQTQCALASAEEQRRRYEEVRRKAGTA